MSSPPTLVLPAPEPEEQSSESDEEAQQDESDGGPADDELTSSRHEGASPSFGKGSPANAATRPGLLEARRKSDPRAPSLTTVPETIRGEEEKESMLLPSIECKSPQNSNRRSNPTEKKGSNNFSELRKDEIFNKSQAPPSIASPNESPLSNKSK